VLAVLLGSRLVGYKEFSTEKLVGFA